ncbi:hypothetical protein LSH36_135g05015 [Paralvinella palmiformis]|uniref:Uncharacterized protein n=1 Tax=Paralvinella palmiformis TaxID=53620 RepID=A0AAD9JW42_9ANNE|nr:hypothetical protein LSH36_135g05015 [Paralvinella palmiformis]
MKSGLERITVKLCISLVISNSGRVLFIPDTSHPRYQSSPTPVIPTPVIPDTSHPQSTTGGDRNGRVAALRGYSPCWVSLDIRTVRLRQDLNECAPRIHR